MIVVLALTLFAAVGDRSIAALWCIEMARAAETRDEERRLWRVAESLLPPAGSRPLIEAEILSQLAILGVPPSQNDVVRLLDHLGDDGGPEGWAPRVRQSVGLGLIASPNVARARLESDRAGSAARELFEHEVFELRDDSLWVIREWIEFGAFEARFGDRSLGLESLEDSAAHLETLLRSGDFPWLVMWRFERLLTDTRRLLSRLR